MKNITIIMKPTSACNLRCKYCYHAEMGYHESLMDDETLEDAIRKVQREFNDIVYVWHGGEPLMCGLEFFKKAFALERKYMRDPMRIRNCVQTNGTLLDEGYINFFKEQRVSVSISFDGPGNLNNMRQLSKKTEGAMELAMAKGLRIAMLSVIHRGNIKYMTRLMEFAKDKGIPIKMNPVFKHASDEGDGYLLEAGEYVSAFGDMYQTWAHDKTMQTDVEPAIQYTKMYFTKRSTECSHRSCLYHWLGIAYDGMVYPCGRNYPEEYRLGNILDTESIQEIFESDTYRALTIASILRREKCKEVCRYFGLCNGGCNSGCITAGSPFEPDESTCSITKGCFEKAKQTLETIITDAQRDPDVLADINPTISAFVNKRNLHENV